MIIRFTNHANQAVDFDGNINVPQAQAVPIPQTQVQPGATVDVTAGNDQETPGTIVNISIVNEIIAGQIRCIGPGNWQENPQQNILAMGRLAAFGGQPIIEVDYNPN